MIIQGGFIFPTARFSLNPSDVSCDKAGLSWFVSGKCSHDCMLKSRAGKGRSERPSFYDEA
jgi:hypothetical protein